MSYTVIILCRNDTQTTYDRLISPIIDLKEIDKVIMVQCSENYYKEIQSPKIHQLKYWDIYSEYGYATKYKAALEPIVTTEAILFVDDSLLIFKSTCKALFTSWQTNPTLVHGNNKLTLNFNYSINKYSLSNEQEEDPHIILTKLCMVSKKNIKEAYKYVKNIEDIFINCDPEYLGIDLCLSIISACSHKTHNRTNIYIPDIKYKTLEKTKSIDLKKGVYSDICTTTIKKYFNVSALNLENINKKYPEILVVIPFFNFARFNKLYSNVQETVFSFNEQNVSTVVMEAVLKGEISQLYTIQCKIITTETDTIAFHKEGLFNKGFSLYKNLFNMFVLCDSDIIFGDKEWAKKLTQLYYNGVEAVQPFSLCHWTTPTRQIERSCISYSMCRYENVKNGTWNNYRVQSLRRTYHPGFVWAFSKKFLERTNGVYSKCFTGSGDEMLVFLVEGMIPMNLNTYKYLQPDLNNFLQYGGAKQDSMKGEIYHLYHGNVKHRRYFERHSNILNKNINIGPDFFSPELEDHLVKAINPKVNQVNLAYFKGRKEDD